MDEPSVLLLRPSLPLAPNPRGKSQLLSPTQGHCSWNSLFSCASLSPSLLVHFHNDTEYSIYLLLKEKKILRNLLLIPPLLLAIAPISLLHVASQLHERAFSAPSPAPMITHKPTPIRLWRPPSHWNCASQIIGCQEPVRFRLFCCVFSPSLTNTFIK